MSPSSKRRRVLFVHNDDPTGPLSSFFLHDIASLKKRFEVEVLSLQPYKHGHLDALAIPAIWRSVARCDVIFAWFGTSAPIVLLGSLLRKPSIVIAGGSDVVYVPEINYGLNPAHKVSYALVLLGYRRARKVLLFSRASWRDFLKLPGVNPSTAEPLYLGVDSEHFKPGEHKSNHVLSVSYISQSAIRRKGILTLLEAARKTPEISYRIAGLIVDDSAKQQVVAAAPPNVAFLGYLDDRQLLQELQAAKVYAQLSYHEGFGMAVAEAMACGCIPVVTDRGSLPEVAGGTGFVAEVEDAEAAAACLRAAIAADDGRGMRARQHIVDSFKPAAREQALYARLDEVLR